MRVIVQHHPARLDLLSRLLTSLDWPAEVVPDPDPHAKLKSAWRTYRACLERLGADAGLIVQDDAVAAPGWAPAAMRAVERYPDRLVAFFHGATPPNVTAAVMRAHGRGKPVVELTRGWVPAVATFWPANQAPAFLDWLDHERRPLPSHWRADDSLIGQWAYRKGGPGCLLTVPNLFEHPDDFPSMSSSVTHRSGRNRGRCSVLLAGHGDELLSRLA